MRLIKITGNYSGDISLNELSQENSSNFFSRLYCGVVLLGQWILVVQAVISIFIEGLAEIEKFYFLLMFFIWYLRAVCCKNRLRVCKIEKSDFLKICQNKGFGEVVLQNISFRSFRFLFIFSEYFRILPCAAVKINAKIVTFPEAPVQIFKAS